MTTQFLQAEYDEMFDMIEYPESDGLPMADNTKQFEWIVTIKGGLDALLPNDFVAGDLFWYPIKGNNRIKQAPDVMVALGRPKGDRKSYKQWEEAGVAPHVVFEILSPGNTTEEMLAKFEFYARYGVEEYYVYDPNTNGLFGWDRSGDKLDAIPIMSGRVSPLLGIRFERTDETLEIYRPDGRRFETFIELEHRAETERHRAEAERSAKEAALQQVEIERQRAEAEHRRAERLAELLRQLGHDPDSNN